jgi:tetratricopeptide (TPR) repeat protein
MLPWFRYLLIVICCACSSHQSEQNFAYGTQSPIALQDYEQGWRYILDEGRWTAAEASFRAAVANDSAFYLAWAQVGRISADSVERRHIAAMLNERKSSLEMWEQKLLDVYLQSLHLIDRKDRGIGIEAAQVKEFYRSGEQYFSEFLKLYPNERYVFAEYIELIHGIYGAQAALDSLSNAKEALAGIPFLISYKAQLLAEAGQYEQALIWAEKYKKQAPDTLTPQIYYTYAYIHWQAGDSTKALEEAQKCLRLDDRHTLARRLYKVSRN